MDTSHRECLTIVWAILLLRLYLESVRFMLRMDHHALHGILSLADATGQLARWRLRLMGLDGETVHRAGIKHQATDAFSRLLANFSDRTMLKDDIPIMDVTRSSKQALITQKAMQLTALTTI